MSKEVFNAIDTIMSQCNVLESHGQKLLALKIIVSIAEELRNSTTEPKGSDDRG